MEANFAAAALHGGSIAVENRPDSHGTRATLRLRLRG